MAPLLMTWVFMVTCPWQSFAAEIFTQIQELKSYYISSKATVASFVTSPASRAECFIACAGYLRCVSVFYHSQDGRCQLQEGRFYLPLGGEAQTGWQYWVLGTGCLRCVSVFYHSQDGRCQLQEGRFYLAQGGVAQTGWQYWVLSTNTASCPTARGYIYHRAMGLCYKPRFDLLLTGEKARDACHADGGHLLFVDSQEKQDLVASQLRITPPANETHGGNEGFYIAGTRMSDSVWKESTTGKTMSFFAWYGEGAMGKPQRTIIAMSGEHDFNWIALNPRKDRPFICEIDVKTSC